MKFSVSACMCAVLASAARLTLAAPSGITGPLIKRNGPSGRLLSPTNYNIKRTDGFYFDYEPVEAVDGGNSGQTTSAVVINMVQGETIVPLQPPAIGLKDPHGGSIYPNEFVDFTSTTRQGFKCGSWKLEVTEFQVGPVYNGSFLAAAPTLNIAC